MTRVSAVVLAAGLSSRMGEFKPLLPLAGEPALGRVVRTLREAGTEEVVVVTGHRADEVAAFCAGLGVRVAKNPDYAEGMYGSVRAGVRALPEGSDGFFLLPVDIPLVRAATLRRLREDFTANRALVTHPAFLGERGHPPLLTRELVSPILRHSGEGGLRGVLERFENDAREVPVADQGVLLDMDRPEDHARLDALARSIGPTDAECEALLRIADTPERAVEHSRVVARAAVRMAECLNRVRPMGSGVNVDLTRSAALLHDVCKGRPRHAQAGAELLREHGFPETADIVAEHPDLDLAECSPLAEREIVFLADKFVQGTRIVPIVDRYLAKLEKFQGNTQAVEAVRARLARAERVLLRFCTETGARLPELLLADAAENGA